MTNRLNKPAIKRRIISKFKGQKLMDPRLFLSARRLDLAAKTAYARAYIDENTSSWPEYVYKEHIRAFNNFYEDEPPKNSYEDFKNSFIRTIDGVKKDDNWKHLAPVLNNGAYLMNGAHRTAASIVLGDRVNAKQPKEVYIDNYNYELFRSDRPNTTAIDDAVLDYMTIEYVSLKSSNIFVAVVFPAAEGHRDEAHKHLLSLGEIVNMKTFKHDEFIGREVIKQLYCNDPKDEWNEGIDFTSADYKAGFCFDGVGDLRVYVLEANLDESTRINEKKYLRDLWKKDKHSIHITDTIEEANRVVRMFFNENSRRLMKIKRGQEFLSESTYQLFETYKSLLPKDVFEREKVAIEGSAVFDLLNIRAGKDIDYISSDKLTLNHTDGIERHDTIENGFHSTTIDEVLTNPRYYFYYKGYKFIDIMELLDYKLNRSEKNKERKDVIDAQMVKDFINENQQYTPYKPIKI